MATKLTADTLQAIEDCGAAEMPIAETLEIAEITAEDWRNDPEAAKRYKKGQLKTKLAIRQAVIKGARSGNPTLLKAYQDFKSEPRAADFPSATAENAGESPQNEGEFDNI